MSIINQLQYVMFIFWRDVSSAVSHCKMVDCFGFNDPLRQYFSLYRVVSQREGEIGEKG